MPSHARWVLAPVAVLLAVTLSGCIGAPPGTGPAQVGDDAPPGGFSSTHVYPGDYSDDESYSLVLDEGPFDVGEAEALYLDSGVDGEAIEVAVVRPDVPEGERVPVVAFASPYLYPLHASDLLDLRPRLTDNFVQHGYAVAFVAVRGTGDSGGCMDLMGPTERADLDQAVTWLGTQDWSNGNVGMIGVSYDGSTPWEVAAEGNPHLRTIVPISGVNDLYHLMYQNGTSETRGPVVLNALYYGWFAFSLPDRSPQHVATSVVCPESWEGLVASTYSPLTGERDPTGFWAERNSRPGVEESYNGSIFLVQGLQDWNVDPHHAYPWVLQLEQSGLPVKHLLGQWGHAWPDGDYLPDDQRRLDFAEVLLHWFDYWLKEDRSRDLGPRVQVQDSDGQWRSADAWPPADAEPLTLYLSEDGLTADSNTSTAQVPVAVDETLVLEDHAASPSPLGCQTCATFTSDPFEEGLRFAGLPPLHVRVTPTGATGHLAAFLYHDDGGELTRLGWTQMDLRFADGDETAEPVVPGETIVARMQFEPLDAVVPPGARLVLAIGQGQRGDEAPVVPPSYYPLVPPSPVLLEVGGDQSTLELSTFTVAEDAFFDPPGGT